MELPLLQDRPDPVPRYEGDTAQLQQDIVRLLKGKAYRQITGGLSNPSKMPEKAWGISAEDCITGKKIRKINGSVCESCYALSKQSRYQFATVLNAMQRRKEGIYSPDWVPAMIIEINQEISRLMRWFDSGDIQSLHHLLNIFRICQETRSVLHWLPTREGEFLKEALNIVELPENLNIWLSTNMIDGQPPTWWPNRITVVRQRGRIEGSHHCPAPEQGNKCFGENSRCDHCWTGEGDTEMLLH